MRLTPLPGTQTYQRSNLEIHGDSSRHPGAASTGCIILPPEIRRRLDSLAGSNFDGHTVIKPSLILAVCLGATAAGATTLPTPSAVVRTIARQGPRAAVTGLAESGQMARIYDLVGSGDRPWIAIVPSMADGTDGADGEGLGIELARALPLSTAAVLRVLRSGGGVIGVERVCSVPFIETTARWNTAYERRTSQALERVGDPRLARIRDRCLRVLRG